MNLKMKFSAVILSYNSIRYIEKCITSLLGSLEAFNQPFEIYVVDNGSVDGCVDIIKKYENSYPSIVKGIYFTKNTGTTFSRNSALRKCIGENILILDSDAYVNYEAIKKLEKNLNFIQKCGISVPKLIYPDGRFQLSVDKFPTLIRKLQRFFFLKKIEENSHRYETNTHVVQVDYAISAFWLIKRETFNLVGFLDEKIFYSPEDVDYCIRVWKSGYSIEYDNSVSVVHDAQEISRAKGVKINFFTLSHIKGLLYLFFKHRFLFSGKKLKPKAL